MIIMIIIPYYCYGARVLLIACCKYTRMDRLLVYFYRLIKQIEMEMFVMKEKFYAFFTEKNIFLFIKKLLLFVLTRRRFISRRQLLLFNFSFFFFRNVLC